MKQVTNIKRPIRKVIISGVFVLVATNSLGQVQQYNLTQLLDSALVNNYVLKSTEKNSRIKQTEIEMLQTNYLPRVSSSASFSYWKFLLPNKERLLGNTLSDMYTDVSFYQPVYDFGQTKAKKSMVENEIQLNDEIVRQIRQTIIWGVTNGYFDVLTAGAEITVRESAVAQLNEHLKYTENLYKIGKVSSVDVLKIKVQITVEEKKLQTAQNELINQKINLIQLCNLQNTNDINIENLTKELFNRYQKQDIDNEAKYADQLNNHPSLVSYDVKTKLESQKKDLYKLQNRPELFSYGIASWEHGYIPFGDNFNYNIGVGIRYTLPYWGNSSYKYQIRQSDVIIDQYRDQKNQAFWDVKKEIDMSINTLDEIRNNLSNNKEIISMAEETIKNASLKYQSGQGNIIDILDAQQILTEATIEYEKAMIEYLQTLAELHYLSGNDNYPFLN